MLSITADSWKTVFDKGLTGESDKDRRALTPNSEPHGNRALFPFTGQQ